MKVTKADIVISAVKPEQYPIMQDLYNYICEKYENSTDDYNRTNYKVLKIYLRKINNI